MERICKKCNIEKPIEEFGKYSSKGRTYSRWQCIPCELQRNREYLASKGTYNADRCRVYTRTKKWNLTEGGYEAMFDAQGGVCAICGSPPDDNKSLAVDHDHSCCPEKKSCGKCIRKLLCDNCNNGLGRFKDDIDRLEKAIVYLRAHRTQS